MILIYKEKHHTYISRLGVDLPPLCLLMEDLWILKDGEVAFRDDGAIMVRRYSVPSLEELRPLTELFHTLRRHRERGS